MGGKECIFLVFFVLGIIREKGDGEMDVRRMIRFECGVSNKKMRNGQSQIGIGIGIGVSMLGRV